MLLISDRETTIEKIRDNQICPNVIRIIVKRKRETESAVSENKCLTTEHVLKEL